MCDTNLAKDPLVLTTNDCIQCSDSRSSGIHSLSSRISDWLCLPCLLIFASLILDGSSNTKRDGNGSSKET